MWMSVHHWRRAVSLGVVPTQGPRSEGTVWQPPRDSSSQTMGCHSTEGMTSNRASARPLPCLRPSRWCCVPRAPVAPSTATMCVRQDHRRMCAVALSYMPRRMRMHACSSAAPLEAQPAAQRGERHRSEHTGPHRSKAHERHTERSSKAPCLPMPPSLSARVAIAQSNDERRGAAHSTPLFPALVHRSHSYPSRSSP